MYKHICASKITQILTAWYRNKWKWNKTQYRMENMISSIKKTQDLQNLMASKKKINCWTLK